MPFTLTYPPDRNQEPCKGLVLDVHNTSYDIVRVVFINCEGYSRVLQKGHREVRSGTPRAEGMPMQTDIFP